jgi:hypothetical protein
VGAGGFGFAASEAFTDAQGSFRLAALAPGEIEVRVAADGKGKAEKRFRAAAGDELRWDVVLGAGLALAGRVLDPSGAPLGAWSVGIESDSGRAEDSFHARVETDAQGRFRVPDCKDVPLRLEVYDPKGNYVFPALTRRGVRPGGAEVVLRVPSEGRASAFITGVVVDAEDRPIGSASISPWSSATGVAPVLTSEAGTGRFRIGPITPGTYSLMVQARGFAELRTEQHELGVGATWDLGRVRLLAGGTLTVSVRTEDGSVPPEGVRLAVQDFGRGASGRIELENGRGRSGVLAPGPYRLVVQGAGIAWEAVPCEIVLGRETRLELVARPGIPQAIRFAGFDGGAGVRSLRLSVRDASGKAVIETMVRVRAGEPFAIEPGFRPGDYRLEASTPSGRRGSAAFTVAADGPGEPLIVELQ